MTDEFNAQICKLRHDRIDDAIDELKQKIKGMENKFWAIILLLISNLAGVLAVLAKG